MFTEENRPVLPEADLLTNDGASRMNIAAATGAESRTQMVLVHFSVINCHVDSRQSRNRSTTDSCIFQGAVVQCRAKH